MYNLSIDEGATGDGTEVHGPRCVFIWSCGPLDLQVFMDHPGYHVIGAASSLPVAEELSRCVFTFIIRFIQKEGFRSGFNTLRHFPFFLPLLFSV